MHHSSEDYNLTIAFRQGMLQNWLAILFHLPESLIIPPSAHLVHYSLNKISQVWVHTEVIRSLGPLEDIIVTPSHHRVHHGRNRYCIDKNYGGLLIIWDKIFGTFQKEKPDEPVVYGLVHNVRTFDALHCQFYHFKYIFFEKIPSMAKFCNKLKSIFYGPGWFPGTPRLGNLSDIPEIEKPAKKYRCKLSLFVHIYWAAQLLVTYFIYLTFAIYRETMPFSQALFYALLLLFTAQSCGTFMDNKQYAPYVELARCVVLYYWFSMNWPYPTAQNYVLTLFGAGAAFWFIITIVNKTKLSVDRGVQCFYIVFVLTYCTHCIVTFLFKWSSVLK